MSNLLFESFPVFVTEISTVSKGILTCGQQLQALHVLHELLCLHLQAA